MPIRVRHLFTSPGLAFRYTILYIVDSVLVSYVNVFSRKGLGFEGR